MFLISFLYVMTVQLQLIQFPLRQQYKYSNICVLYLNNPFFCCVTVLHYLVERKTFSISFQIKILMYKINEAIN